MVLTPEAGRSLGTLETGRDRLVVLPKWLAEPDQSHPGWQANAVPVPEFLPAAVLPKTLKGVTVGAGRWARPDLRA